MCVSRSICLFALATALLLAAHPVLAQTSSASQTPPQLGRAAPAPPGLKLNQPPAATPRPLLQSVTGGFSVNTDSREEVRAFYNALFPSSDRIPQDSTADAAACFPGHNANAFQEAELRRINWFRALAGLPANIVLDPTDNWGSQQMAIIQSDNNVLDHDPTNTYLCYNDLAAHYAGGDQALGADGADAIKNFIWDYGANNNEVGHRRWLLYPAEVVMGVGDVPGNGPHAAANLTYVFDPASFGPRPATRHPYVAWPPAGFVPYPVVFPYWSVALTNADFTNATVTMKSNGVPVSVALQPYQTGFGENTLVWVPLGLDATTGGTTFPFNGTDTVYTVTVTNINQNGNRFGLSYSVTVFDPAVPGTDYVASALSGPAQLSAGSSGGYTVTPPNNPHVTSYNLLSAQVTNFQLFDNGNAGLSHFTLSPPPNYSPTTTQPFGSGTCFNLQHAGTNAAPQWLTLNTPLLPATNTLLTFKSLIGFAYNTEVARVQISADNGVNWQDLFTEAGCNAPTNNNPAVCESSFSAHSLSLSNYAGQTLRVRFNFDFLGGSYISGGSPIGWFFTDVLVTNTQALVNLVTNLSTVTNLVAGDLLDSANNGLANFTLSPPPYYYVITNPPAGAEPNCFHLTHLDPTSQFLQLNEALVPGPGTTLSFKSLLGYVSPDEVARLQVSTNAGASWDDLYVQTGLPDDQQPVESDFTPHSLSLAHYAGAPTCLRFTFTFSGGEYWPYSDNDTGWIFEDVAISNTLQQAVTVLNTTNFSFTPTQPGTYLLQAQPVLYTQFPLPFGPGKLVNVVSNTAPILVMNRPVRVNNQVQLNFSVTGGSAGSFHLLQAAAPAGAWTTNTQAALSTNTPGLSYRFTLTNAAAAQFYRVQSP